ncbi:hypothetical protein [Gordonia sp. SND2]|uniref:DUF7427 family protein n=1 Tax=Gordonia sp. SND2 TaxID=3388659 RepID=UPI00398A75E2
MTAGQAWAVLIGAIGVYEVLSADGELLSEGVKRARGRHWSANVAVAGAVLTTAAHLLDVLPDRVDPFSAGLRVVRPLRDRR